MNFSQISFGEFALKFYGIFLSIAFFVAVWSFYKRLQAEKLDIDFFLHHFWRWVLGGLVLGRIFVLMLYPEVWERYGVFSFFAFWDRELNSLGVLIGFVLTLFLDVRAHKISIPHWLDLGIFPFLLGCMIMDVAAFLTGEIYGIGTNFFWGVRYETFGVESINPVHPVTIYALFLHIWIYVWLKIRTKQWVKFPGRLALWGGFLFVATDFLLQFLRADPTMVFGIMRVEQILEIVLLLFFWWGIKTFKYGKKKY